MASIDGDELECSVCYGQTDTRTTCGHLLCAACRVLLPKPLCPLCRQELQPLTGYVRRNGGSQPARQRSVRGNRPPRMPRLVQSSVSAGGDDALESRERSGEDRTRASSERPRRRMNAAPSPRSPFTAWLHTRDTGTSSSRSMPSARSVRVRRDESPRSSPVREDSTNNLSISQLVPRIGRMSFAEVPRFVQHVAWLNEFRLVDFGRAALLRQTLKRRMAELFSVAPLSRLGSAGDMLLSLEEHIEPRCDPLRRALEARLSYLLHHPADGAEAICPFDYLRQHYEVATCLTERHLISGISRNACISHLQRWFEKATIAEFEEHAGALSALCNSDNGLDVAISKRVFSILQHSLSIEKLDRLLKALMDMEGHGFHIIDGQMEHSMLGQIRSGLETWQPTRIKGCLARIGGFRKFCTKRPGVVNEVKSLLLERIVKAVVDSSSSLKHATELQDIHIELNAWAQLAKCAIGAGLLEFDTTSSAAIVDAVAGCTARCMGLTEFHDSMKEVRNLEWAMLTVIACGQSGHNGER